MTCLSVILPVYNGGNFVEAAVESILRQTVRDFELILIDDGSTDQTAQILEKMQTQDSRIVLISRENRGLVATLNEGIDRAQGDWIARMDADDIALPNRFERQLHWLEKTGADICGTWVQFTGTPDRRVLAHPCSEAAIRVAMLFGSPFAHPSVIIKRELAYRLRYDPQWDTCEDYDLWVRAALVGARMVNAPEVLLEYRLHSGQVSTKHAARQLELAQEIRRRCWAHYLAELKLDNSGWIGEVLNLREPNPRRVNIELIEQCFATLLQKLEGEAKSTMVYHMTNLFKRAGANGLGILIAWRRLNCKFGSGIAFSTQIQLGVLGLFRWGPSHAGFYWLKGWGIRSGVMR